MKEDIQPKKKPEKTTISIVVKPPNGRNYIARLTEYSGKTSFPLRWSISSVPGLTCKVTLSITPQEDHRRTERDKNNHADQQRGNGSGAPASPSRPGTDRQTTSGAGIDCQSRRRKGKSRTKGRGTGKGNCPATLRELCFAGVQRKGIPGTVPGT